MAKLDSQAFMKLDHMSQRLITFMVEYEEQYGPVKWDAWKLAFKKAEDLCNSVAKMGKAAKAGK